MFKKYIYSILIGAPNSGKTEWFLKQELENKLFISVVDIQHILPLNKNIYDFYRSNCSFLNLDSIFIKNIDETTQTDMIKSNQLINYMIKQEILDFFDKNKNKNFNICVDEIHFFKELDFLVLDFLLLKLNNFHLYFTMLPQSDNNKFLSNTTELFLNCNDVIFIPSKCHVCKTPSIQASAITPRNEFNNICDKSMFVTMCKKCKIKIKNKFIKNLDINDI
jgi:hypothetical protein